MSEERKLAKRSDKVMFGIYGTVDKALERMKGFKKIAKAKNPMEYTRQYVDEAFETTDTYGMSEEVEFELDYHANDKIHAAIEKVYDEELIGDDAVFNLVQVDFTKPVQEQANQFHGIQRLYSLIPDSEGDGTEAYVYSGSFKAKSEVKKVVVTVDADHKKVETYAPAV